MSKRGHQLYFPGRRSDNILGDEIGPIPARRTNRKPIKRGVINANKALLVTKAHSDSKVEATIQRSLQAQLAELQTEDTPAGVFEDANDDTSEDEN